jgi:hypothetical protein
MMWSLTDDQLLLLDGKADEKMQPVIDGIKLARSCGADVPLIGEVIAKAQEAGWMRIMKGYGRWCGVCGKSAGYALHTRNGRYHRKGDKNHDKPLNMAGVSFESSCITIRDHIDCCSECDTKKGISAAIINLIVSQELPIEIRNNERNLFTKDDERECWKCKAIIYESEMGKLQTLMGDGYYPGKCQKCGAESLAFGRNHRSTGKFRMLRKAVKEATP